MADLSRVQAWFDRMNQLGQADIPFHFGKDMVTPRELLQHAQANDDVWKRVQNQI